LNPASEQELLDALRVAEQSGDLVAIEQAVSRLSLFYTVAERFTDAAPYWQKGALLVEQTTASDSQELATYLHNMAAYCFAPGGMIEQARSTFVRAQEIYLLHFSPDAEIIRDIQRRLHEIQN
jgi:hypothetical protein